MHAFVCTHLYKSPVLQVSYPVHDIFYCHTWFWSFKRLVDIMSSVTGNFMYSVNGVLYGLTSQPIELNIYMSLKCQENLSISLACFLKTCTIKELRLSGIVWYVASFISKSKVSLATVESQRSFNIESHRLCERFLLWPIYVGKAELLFSAHLTKYCTERYISLKQKCHHFDEISSLAVLKVVILTTFSAVNDENFVKWRRFRFSVWHLSMNVCMVVDYRCKNKTKTKKTLFKVGQYKQFNISSHLKWVLVANKSMHISHISKVINHCTKLINIS